MRRVLLSLLRGMGTRGTRPRERRLALALAAPIFLLLLDAVAVAQDIDPASGNAQPYPGTPVSGYKLAWSDEFNTTSLDTAKWNYRTDGRYWSKQLPANVSVSAGVLNLHLKMETVVSGTTTYNYTAGGVISKNLVRYGYYEARMKVPPGRGWHTSFWMMKYNRPASDTVAIELDAIENDSVNVLKYSVNVHRHLPTPHLTFGNKSIATPSLSGSFQVIACEFTPATVKYFLNGAVVQTVDATQFPHNDMNIWLTSIAAPLGETLSVDDTQLPSEAQFDYVRYFVPSATATVSIVSPGPGGVTLSDTNTALRVTAQAGTSDPAFPPTVLWSKASGPGEVTFANTTATDTTAQFSASGNYVLQCQVTVDGNIATAQAVVAVNSPLTVSLRQGEGGYSHVATFIRGDSVNWNSGARDQIIVGRWNNQSLRPIFSFDLSPLDPAAIIQSATLDLWTDNGAGTGSVAALELHSLTGTPVEGTGDGSSATNGAGTGATWNARTSGTNASDLWANAGGDYDATVLSDVPGFDATVTMAQKTFTSSTNFVATAQSALSAGKPLDLIVLSPLTESGTTNSISRITSDDSALAAQRPQLTLTFFGNLAPSLSAGVAPMVPGGVSVPLSGTATGAAGSVWTQVSGTGSVTFENANAPDTTAIFSQPGTYALRLTASNARGETSRAFSVTALSKLDNWRYTNFGTAANTFIAADTFDANGDGEPNLLEFATGQNPNATTRQTGVLVKSGTNLEFTYTRGNAAIADGIGFAVEWSDTLAPASWSTSGVTQAMIPGSDDGSSQQWKATVPAGSGLKRFVRLKVTK